MGEHYAVVGGQVGDEPGELEAGTHPVEVGEPLAERLADDLAAARLVGERADSIRVDVVDMGEAGVRRGGGSRSRSGRRRVHEGAADDA